MLSALKMRKKTRLRIKINILFLNIFYGVKDSKGLELRTCHLQDHFLVKQSHNYEIPRKLHR